jgi:hypothetical protein
MAVGLWFLQGLEGRTIKYEKLTSSGVPIEAIVVRPDCGYHSTIIYHFNAAGNDIESRDYSGTDCGLIQSGQKIRIYYLPESPSVNMVGEPALYLSGQRKFALGSSLVLPILILWAYTRRRRINENS